MSKKVTLLPEQLETYKQELEKLYKQIHDLKDDKKSIKFIGTCGNDDSMASFTDSSLLMELSRIATRINELEELLGTSKILNNEYTMTDVITIGTTFTIDTDLAKDITFTLVEVGGNPIKGLVSIESPIGAAVVNKAEGESFSYVMPNKKTVNGVIKSILNKENSIDNEKKLVATKK